MRRARWGESFDATFGGSAGRERRRSWGRRPYDRPPTALAMASIGFAAGAAAGMLAWGALVERARRDLFNPSPLRRLAAIGFIAGRPTVDSARLLGDYLHWEQRPFLRTAAREALRRLEDHLDEA